MLLESSSTSMVAVRLSAAITVPTVLRTRLSGQSPPPSTLLSTGSLNLGGQMHANLTPSHHIAIPPPSRRPPITLSTSQAGCCCCGCCCCCCRPDKMVVAADINDINHTNAEEGCSKQPWCSSARVGRELDRSNFKLDGRLASMEFETYGAHVPRYSTMKCLAIPAATPCF